MISSIEGELTSVAEGRAELNCGSLSYCVLVPAHDVQQLAIMVGQTVRFDTLHYLEGQGQGSSFVPRLIGFQSPEDRAFFELFTTVKGVGNRKALRALQLSFGSVAQAIAEGDLDLLVSLPEIGKRTAQTILAELEGKVDRFLEMKPLKGVTSPVDDARMQMIQDAVGVLVQLGENRVGARQMVDRAMQVDPDANTPDALVAVAFRMKETM